MDKGFVEGLILRHNDKTDNLFITNINLASAANISLASTMNTKGDEEIKVDAGLGYMIFQEHVDNGNKGEVVTKYVAIDDISQITVREFEYQERKPGKIYPNYN